MFFTIIASGVSSYRTINSTNFTSLLEIPRITMAGRDLP